MKAFTSFLVLSFVALTLSLSADYTYDADSVVLSVGPPTITINNADIKTTVEFAPGVCQYPSPSPTTNSVFSLINGGSLTAFTSLNQLVQTCGFQKVASDIEIGNDKFTSFGSQVTVTRVRGSTTTVVEQDILVLYPQAFVTDASVKVARDTLGTDFSIVVDSVTYAPNVWTIGVTTSTPAPYKISLTSVAEFDGFSLGSITEGSSSEDGTNLEQKWTFTVTNDISDDTCKAFDMTIAEFFTATPMCIEDDCSTDGSVPDSFKIDLSVKTSGSCAVQQTVATFTTPSVTTTAFKNSYDSAATKDIFGTSQTIYFDTEFTDLPNNMEISGSISQLCVVTATDKVNCARDITAMVTLQTAIDINHIGFTVSASQLKSANSDVAGSEDIYVRISYDLDFADASRKRSALVRTAIHKIVVGDMESSTGTSLFVPLLMIALFALIA